MNTRDLGPEGRRLVRTVLDQLKEDGLTPDAREEVLLRNAGRLEDRLAQLRETLQNEGLTVPTASGIGVKPHPLLALEGQLAGRIKSLLDGLSFTTAPVKNAARSRAAASRWRGHNTARGV